ncbi:TetR/AcrR family transcriptional regulator [Pedobacter xixiisoli]|uniref:Transcriptional regulator, TetR family n=1 Tax=Pedobacter xixiisoli TaxID=1476464 RepID=A0A285ZPZ1_9SPHI|nr:TetR/AcrR family transcriptional regulator [Pedobacter xixiisoli]SOD11726.1 transcriptional regulator, TetR family [Pedobacter xixiisoli]
MSHQTTESKRKITDGMVRNKERTKKKMLEAVGDVLKEKGYAGLTINNIVKKAGVDRKLIALYFGSLNNMIEEYLIQRDYWMTKVAPKLNAIVDSTGVFGEHEIVSILHTLYDEIDSSPDFQKILSWEVCEYQDKLRALADKREELGTALYKLTDKDFEGTNLNLRAIIALQVAGIYYMILHAKSTGSNFCEIDINTKEGQQLIKEALTKIVALVYNEAGIQNTFK